MKFAAVVTFKGWKIITCKIFLVSSLMSPYTYDRMSNADEDLNIGLDTRKGDLYGEYRCHSIQIGR